MASVLQPALRESALKSAPPPRPTGPCQRPATTGQRPLFPCTARFFASKLYPRVLYSDRPLLSDFRSRASGVKYEDVFPVDVLACACSTSGIDHRLRPQAR